jgi:hypothetical protein
MGIVFVLGVALLVRPHSLAPCGLEPPSLSSVSREVLSSAREAARQIRAVASG